MFVYWRSIQEIAGAIHKWADATSRIGSVETIIDLTDDPANKKEIFYKLPIETVLKACTALQQQGKAQVFYSDNTDTHGVKFFNIWLIIKSDVNSESNKLPKLLAQVQSLFIN